MNRWFTLMIHTSLLLPFAALFLPSLSPSVHKWFTGKSPTKTSARVSALFYDFVLKLHAATRNLLPLLPRLEKAQKHKRREWIFILCRYDGVWGHAAAMMSLISRLAIIARHSLNVFITRSMGEEIEFSGGRWWKICRKMQRRKVISWVMLDKLSLKGGNENYRGSRGVLEEKHWI